MSFQFTIQDYPHYTYKDYEKWEGDWELIRGIPYAMAPSPAWQHQSFGGRFVSAFLIALQKVKDICQCEILYETDWKVSEDTVVRPDVMVVCEPINGDYVTNPPALILEILSPSTVLKDRNTKFNLYKAYGVRYYLIADIGKKSIEIFQLKDNVYQEANELTQFNLTPHCSAELQLRDLFS